MPDSEPERPGGSGRWLLAMTILVLAGIVVPYGMLGGSAPGFAIAAFWLVFGLAVAGMIVLGVSRWRDKS